MKEHQKRDILIISSVLVVVLLAVLMINRDKPFSIFSSGDQVKQVTNAYLQQTDQLEPDFTPNPNEAITLSTDSTLAAESQLTPTQQSSDFETETYLPSDTQALSVSATGTTSASIVATNTRPPAATSTKASSSTQATQSVGTSYPVPTNQTASTNTPVPTNAPSSTQTPTSKPTQTNQPSSTNTPVPTIALTSILTATATATPTKTATATATATMTLAPTGWEGEWIVWFQEADGNYVSGELTIDAGASEFTTTALLGGKQYTFEGRIIFDGEQVLGSWTSDTASGGFWWGMLESQEFIGCWGSEYGFCGTRAGQSQPDPCFSPAPR